MFKRSFGSKDRAGKATRPSKKSFVGSHVMKQKLLESFDAPTAPPVKLLASPSSAVVTIGVGPTGRTFAAHEDVLARSPYFARLCQDLYFQSNSNSARHVNLLQEDPETFSCVLEYLYKGDYSPALLRSKARGYYVDDGAFDPRENNENAAPSITSAGSKHERAAGARNAHAATLHHTITGETLLRDTVVYCAAQKYELPALQKLALRKQGLQSGIDVGTILRSMRYAYKNTPETDSRLRAHFLALIVRARRTFKRSGTMQMEMARGGTTMFFDLFVALCNHLDDLESASTTPKTV